MKVVRRTAGAVALGVAMAAGLAVAGPVGPAAAGVAPPSYPGVVRGGNLWLLRDSQSVGPATISFTYGSPTDTIHVMGDWNGDGTKTPGIVRIQGDLADSQYVWYLRNSNSAGPADIKPFAYGKPSFGFEEPGDIPMVGDWDGDGKDTVGVVRRRNGQANTLFLLRNANTAGPATLAFPYGSISDAPAVTGDWDGTGSDTAGVIRNFGRGTLTWLLRNSNYHGQAQIQFNYGTGFDQPIVGDWNGDGVDGVGITRTFGTTRSWYLRNPLTSGPAETSFNYGRAADAPVVWK